MRGAGSIAMIAAGAGILALAPASGARLGRSPGASATGSGAAASGLAHLYWTEPETSKGPSGSGIDTLWRSDLNGMNVNSNFIAHFAVPGAVAVSDSHIYFSDDEAGAIGRARLDGTHVDWNYLSSRLAEAIAITTRYIYFTDSNSTSPGPAVWRANLDGSHVRRLFLVGPATFLGGLAVQQGHIYWTNRDKGTVGRADLNGTHVNRHLITGLNSPNGLAAASGQLYWASTVTGPGAPSSIGRASLGGANVQPNFITGLSYPFGVAVGAGHLYWADYGAGTIGRARLDGTHVQRSFISAQPMYGGSAGAEPFDIAIGP
jgi:hypothetical protein